MRFQIVMNMPSFGGNGVHQIIAEYPVDSLEEFVDALSNRDFIVVDEFYRHNETKEYYQVDPIVLNPLFIGKVKVFKAT
jgi:hypothetical protein